MGKICTNAQDLLKKKYKKNIHVKSVKMTGLLLLLFISGSCYHHYCSEKFGGEECFYKIII